MQFEIEENLLVRTKLLGAHYLPNLKQAVNVAREYNISNKLIAQALANFEPGEEFIQRKTTSDGVTILIDDRTANPDGFRAGLELLQFIEGEKKYVISSGIVDLADKTDEVHIKIGHLAKLIGATFIHTSTTGSAALKDALSENYVSLTHVEAVSKYFNHNLKKSDVVLIEGKLHPTIASYIQEL